MNQTKNPNNKKREKKPQHSVEKSRNECYEKTKHDMADRVIQVKH